LADLNASTISTAAAPRGVAPEPSAMTWKRICEAADVPENAVKKFDVDGISLVVVNYGEGFRAIPPICPHMEEPLAESGVVAQCVLTCTKHLWAWDLRTLEMQGETERPLKTYDIKQENGILLANVENELTYDFDDGEGETDDDDFFK
jgi:toluene monooxygenase system ferredoxin subunit